MFRFLIKKNFADIWDNLFHLIVLNLFTVFAGGICLAAVMLAVAEDRLDQIELEWRDDWAVSVVLASDGYPQKYQTGFPITVDDGMQAELYIAGAKRVDGQLLTAGGRVLGVTATAPTLREAVDKAYENAQKVHFDNAYCRRDIGQRALKA